MAQSPVESRHLRALPAAWVQTDRTCTPTAGHSPPEPTGFPTRSPDTSCRTAPNHAGSQFRLHYAFAAEPTDNPDDLAAYLGIDVLGWSPVTSARPLLATDPDDGRLIANTAMVDLLRPLTSGLEWQRYKPATVVPRVGQ